MLSPSCVVHCSPLHGRLYRSGQRACSTLRLESPERLGPARQLSSAGCGPRPACSDRKPVACQLGSVLSGNAAPAPAVAQSVVRAQHSSLQPPCRHLRQCFSEMLSCHCLSVTLWCCGHFKLSSKPHNQSLYLGGSFAGRFCLLRGLAGNAGGYVGGPLMKHDRSDIAFMFEV